MAATYSTLSTIAGPDAESISRERDSKDSGFLMY